jgi:hypothetical protein
VAGPGSRNYIIRGILDHEEEVEIPELIDGDPVTSFMPSVSFCEEIVYPGIRRLRLPGRLGRVLERNDIFPDLEELQVDPANRIFSTDGKMLYRDEGRELCLSLAAGISDEVVTVPERVERLGAFAFADSKCQEIVFENPWIEAEDTSFDRSVWLDEQGPAAYVGNMLYRVNADAYNGRIALFLREGTQRVGKRAFAGLGMFEALKLCVPQGMKCRGLADVIISGLSDARVRFGGDRAGLVTVVRMAGEGGLDKEIPVPVSLDSGGMNMLRETIDCGAGLYDEVFERIGNRKEKVDYALYAASDEGDVNEELYRQAISGDAYEAALRAVQILDEKALFRLMKRGFIGKDALIGILPQLQSRGMVNAAAGLLVMINREDAF